MDRIVVEEHSEVEEVDQGEEERQAGTGAVVVVSTEMGHDRVVFLSGVSAFRPIYRMRMARMALIAFMISACA